MKTQKRWYYKISYARVDNTNGNLVEGGRAEVRGTSEEDAVETLRWNLHQRKSSLKWFEVTGQLPCQN